jgi:hypothetical protein
MSSVLQYGRMVDDALKGVLRAALKASVNGLPGNHHFYITFRTGDEGVIVPDHLRARYPSEMTIVIQHQYWGLEVDDLKFAITLSFNRINERLVVPFASVTAFADPSAKFGLQFQGQVSAEAEGRAGSESKAPPSAPASNAEAGAEGAKGEAEAPAEAEMGQVIALDAFRKK